MTCAGQCNAQKSCRDIPADILEKTNRHPCYSFEAHHKYARMHLPVAPKCNISCNYCNRRFDCVNESRPGVTSEVLLPTEALQKYRLVREKIENLSVVGIAGPGDALANWENTKATINLIKELDPNLNICLSTNGLMLPEYAGQLVEMGINHVTVTINCLDPEIGAKIYKFVNYHGIKYQGQEGAKLLISNQLTGIKMLAESGVLVKVNIVMVKGINDQHIPDVVKKVKQLGVFITNIMPLIPAAGSVFENYPQTSMKEINDMRNICQVELPQMRHCRQCRADAIGLLGEDRSQEFTLKRLSPKTCMEITPKEKKQYKIAVATKHGMLIDQHFGYASEFNIYQSDGENFKLLEKRQVEKYCHGVEECDDDETRRDFIISALKDCEAVLTMRIGYHAKERLRKKGILTIESCDTIENGLKQAVKVINDKRVEIA